MNMTRDIWTGLQTGDTIIDYRGNNWLILEQLPGNKLKMSTPMAGTPEAVFIFESDVGVLHEASRSSVTPLSRDIRIIRG